MWNGGRLGCRRGQRRSQGSTEPVSVASLFPNSIRQQLWHNYIGDGAHPMEPEVIHPNTRGAYGRTREQHGVEMAATLCDRRTGGGR